MKLVVRMISTLAAVSLGLAAGPAAAQSKKKAAPAAAPAKAAPAKAAPAPAKPSADDPKAAQAKAKGVRAMLPHVDIMRPVHNLDSIAALCHALSGEGGGALKSPKAWLKSAA